MVIAKVNPRNMTATDTTCRSTFVVPVRPGLHLRPAAMLVRTAGGFDSDVSVHRNGATANGKSLVSVIMLEAMCGAEVLITTVGHDAEAAMRAIGRLFMTGFA